MNRLKLWWSKLVPWVRKVWHDPVWSKVIAEGIKVIGIALLVLIGVVIVKGWAWLTAWTSVPNWLLLIFTVCLAVVAVRSVARLYGRRRTPAVTPKPLPEHHEYTEDIFFKVLWRWGYNDFGNFGGIRCYCPRCNYEIRPQTFMREVSFICHACNYRSIPYELHGGDYPDVIRRLIQQKIDTGTWRRVVHEAKERERQEREARAAERAEALRAAKASLNKQDGAVVQPLPHDPPQATSEP